MQPGNARLAALAAIPAAVLLCLIGAGIFAHRLAPAAAAVACSQELTRELSRAQVHHQALQDSCRRARRSIDELRRVVASRAPKRGIPKREASQAPALDDLAARRDQLRKLLAHEHTRLQDLQHKHNTYRDLDVRREDIRRRIAIARQKHQSLRTELTELQHAPAKDTLQYNVTTLSGAGVQQTDGALFVECSGDNAILQSEAIALSIGPTEKEVSFFLSKARTAQYVVFLVRPNGIEPFNDYYNLIADSNRHSDGTIEVGFEPVDAAWHLHYPGE